MGFLAKNNPLSGKMKFAVCISVLWFLFWVFAGWKGDSIFGGLAFGGLPVAVAWGFWLMLKQPRERDDFKTKKKTSVKEKAAGKREFPRLEYPASQRPVLKFGKYELEIMDISEKGLKLSNDRQVELGRLIHGEAILLCGQSIYVDGEVAWSLNNEVGLLMALIPSSIVAEEKRMLSRKKVKQKKA